MNIDQCANCKVHGWKQPDIEISLLTCKNCESIKYCSNECQDEHWAKVHKLHCQYFADPTRSEAWQHKEEDCSICLEATQVGEASLKEVNNPNYECIFKVEIPQSLIHPHPFPVTGQPGDIYEKAIIILWQLVRKFQLIHPDIAHRYPQEFFELENAFIEERVEIWVGRKIYPQPNAKLFANTISINIADLDDKLKSMATMVQDAFELWNIIIMVQRIVNDASFINTSKFLKDPLVDLPDDIKNLLSEGLDTDNTTKYLTLANKVLESLSAQVIPWEDILKIACDGSLEQDCSICSKDLVIVSDAHVFFTPLHLGKYFCGSQDCQEKSDAAGDDCTRFDTALYIMWEERKANMCDFCFQLTPVKLRGSDIHDIHRCSICKTTMYCSRDCQVQDYFQVHEKACKKDEEGRKKKMGGSARRKAAREEIEKMEAVIANPIFFQVLEKFKQKYAIGQE